jgi:transcriptional regulator with XRE-family HTH domain
MTKLGGWPSSGFGKRLKNLREEKGLTQKALADRAGCHPMTLAKLERGVQEPAWQLVLVLAEALGVPVEAFVIPAHKPAAEPRGRKSRKGAAEPDPDNNPDDRKVRGKGINLAHEALNFLTRIPKDDPLRKRGFQMVRDWIKANQ